MCSYCYNVSICIYFFHIVTTLVHTASWLFASIQEDPYKRIILWTYIVRSYKWHFWDLFSSSILLFCTMFGYYSFVSFALSLVLCCLGYSVNLIVCIISSALFLLFSGFNTPPPFSIGNDIYSKWRTSQHRRRKVIGRM